MTSRPDCNPHLLGAKQWGMGQPERPGKYYHDFGDWRMDRGGSEARYYGELKLRQRAGEVLCCLRQVPIHLLGQTRLVIDFLEFRTDGRNWP